MKESKTKPLDSHGPGTASGGLAGYVSSYSRTNPEAEAVIFGSRRITYRQLQQELDCYARALLADGLKKGDRVAMLCTPRPEFWNLFLAASHIGLIWVGLNPGYRRDELRRIVADCQPRIIFSITQFEGREYCDDLLALTTEFPSVEKLVAIDGDIPGAVPLNDFLSRAEDIPHSSYCAASRSANNHDAALLVYTSGTTGNPKGALISNLGLTRGAIMQATHFGVEKPQIVVNFPIDHVACVADTCATTLVKGGKIVFQERFDPGATLQAIQDEKCTLIAGVPTMLQMMLDQPEIDRYDLSTVECVIWGGAAMPKDAIAGLEKICTRLLSVYGLTESSANIVFSAQDDSLNSLAESIGKPDSSVEARIIDDSGNPCAEGSSGELQFKADFFFLGYWNQPESNNNAFSADGWLKTGDIGFVRDDGNLQLVARKSEMFKSGGYNVYPREIEIVLESLPEVAMAAVVSMPDDRFQEVGHAFVMLESGQEITADELRDQCKQKLANYKIPKEFEIRHSLPMLPVGKIDKQALKRNAISAT